MLALLGIGGFAFGALCLLAVAAGLVYGIYLAFAPE